MQVTNRRVSRAQCNNCTCSPGLLSRSNRRSSWFAKQINLKRNLSGSAASRSGSRKGSVFTIDAASLCLPETKEINTSKRLESLRKAMQAHNLAVYIVPSEDQHQSEYVSPADQKRSFISGFQGSAGVAVITRDVTCMNDIPEGLAALSTDGRYFKQAANELDFNWTLLKQGSLDPSWEEWAIKQAVQLSLDLGSSIHIGVDPKLISFAVQEDINSKIEAALKKYPKAEVELVPVTENLIDSIWVQFEDWPQLTPQIIKTLPEKYAGELAQSKIGRVANFIKSETEGHALVVSALDEIAWLLNLRGSDIEYNPVFYGYVIVTDKGEVTLFADSQRFDSPVANYLSNINVIVKPYSAFFDYLDSWSKDLNLANQAVLLNPSTSSWEIFRHLKCSYKSLKRSPIEDLKAIKNATELEGARSAHLKDGRALVRFFSWLEDQLVNKSELIDEVAADEQLTKFRKTESDFVGLSFSTISASGANGAIIHYKPVATACSVINPDQIYLLDTGSQYLEGTTDTTRTVHFGQPTSVQKKHYTLVLKGNIALGSLKFPEKTTGLLIDSVARQYLWKYGLDYGHGTAHGVGAYLNVHEGPIGIGQKPRAGLASLEPGHLLSNEPGFYEEGEYGIRIENVMYVKDAGYKYNGKDFYEFDTLTRVPFCKKLIDKTLLTADEIKWVNEYHHIVWDELSSSFEKGSLEYTWLRKETLPL